MLAVIALNLSKAEGKDLYKEYLWKVNTGFSVFYGLLGVLMAWVSLWGVF
jgi:hypothetical protein